MRPRWRGSSTIWLIPKLVTPSGRRSETKRSPASGSSAVRAMPSSMAAILRRARQRPQPRPVADHRGVDPVAVGLAAQGRHALAVVGRGERLVVTDDVLDRDREPA